jgi:hypothetical protein
MTYILDQSYTTVNGGGENWQLRQALSVTIVGTTFTPAKSGNCTKVSNVIFKTSTPTGNIWAEIHPVDGSNRPTSTILATSTYVDVSTVGTAADTYVDFLFATPALLTAETMYAIVLNGDFAINGTAYINIQVNSALGYSRGAFFKGSTYPVALDTSYDHNFKEYYTPKAGGSFLLNFT